MITYANKTPYASIENLVSMMSGMLTWAPMLTLC